MACAAAFSNALPAVTAVHAPQAGKSNALHMLANELGIRREEVLAVDDSVNDVFMLNWAGHSVAPAGCDRYVREPVREVLTANGVDGVVGKLRSIDD